MFKNTIKGVRISFFAVISLALITLIGCSSATTPTSPTNEAGQNTKALEPKNGGTVTIGLAIEPDTLDSQKSIMVATNFVSQLVGGSLLSTDPKTHEIVPYLAESYKISEDKKTWTFIIRQGVTFHDGTPLTAMSFKQTFDRALAPETASTNTGPILSSVQSISAPDDKTLIIHLKEPSASLISFFVQPGATQPYSTEALKRFGKEYGRNPVGVGPWKFESWKTGESITLVRNEAYKWAPAYEENQGPPRPDKLVLKYIKDPQTMLAALKSGTIDIAEIQPKDAKTYRNNDQYALLDTMSLGVGFIGMNLENDILKDINVRKAFNMAINKEAYLKAEVQGEGLVSYGPLPSEMFGFDKSIERYTYKYNIDEAKKLLEESGWKVNAQGIREKDGKPLHLNLMTTPSPGIPLIQSMLKEIGADVNIQSIERAAMIDAAAKGSFDLVSLSYEELDPDIMYAMFHSSQINIDNFDRVNNKELDSLLEKSRSAMDRNERQKIFEDMQKLIVEQAYWIPLIEKKKFVVVNKRVQGVKYDTMQELMLQNSWVNQ